MSLANIKRFLEMLDDQSARIGDALQEFVDDAGSLIHAPLNQLANGAPPPLQPGGDGERARSKLLYMTVLWESLQNEFKESFFAALADTESLAAHLGTRWVDSLEQLKSAHLALLDLHVEAAHDWARRNGSLHSDASVSRIEHEMGVQEARLELAALRKKGIHRDIESRIRKKCPLSIKRNVVFVFGKEVPLDMTKNRADDSLTFLKYLIASPGEWISSSVINKSEKSKGRVSDVRWDRIRKGLPTKIRHHIESARSKGYRIRMA